MLSVIGDRISNLIDVTQQSSCFMLACYGQSRCESITAASLKVWSTKLSRNTSKAPELKSLPPTGKAFKENVARAYLQFTIWKHAHDPHHPALDPLEHGWMRDEYTNTLAPITVPQDVPLAPDDILR